MISKDTLDKYDITIGIECHVQLATKSKLFSGSDNDSRQAEPNSNVNAIDYALPGTLPVLNRGAVELAVKAGKALNSTISLESRFDRKHYFYPDLPKGYQTTQMYHPIVEAGVVKLPLKDGGFTDIRIHHAHMEEDAGKLTHYGDYSLVDLNRAGTPLIEIVSEPDVHSAEDAKAFATELYRLMTYAGVTHGDLYHGNMRFDVNVSVALKDATELGTRAEVKNLNSFRSVEKAAEYEFKRQVELIEKGEKIVQETRGWDDAKQKTSSQRSKEDAQDYRYMPDADIPPIVLTQDEVDAIWSTVPALPQSYRDKWQSLSLDHSVVDSLLSVQKHAVLVTEVQARAGDDAATRVAHWFSSALGRADDQQSTELTNPNPAGFIELANMVDKKELSSSAATEVFLELINSDVSARQVAEQRNLLQNSDEDAVLAIVDAVLADPASSQSIEDYNNGKERALGYLVGQVMKQSKGKANPAMAGQLILRRLLKD